MKKVVVLLLILSQLSLGCATSPKNIAASYVSPLQYASLSCEQIQQELIRVSARVAEVSGVQQSKRNKDSWALGIGLVIFWPALFFMMGGDKKEELARLKGEYEALEQAGMQKNCGFIKEMEEIRKSQKAGTAQSVPSQVAPQAIKTSDNTQPSEKTNLQIDDELTTKIKTLNQLLTDKLITQKEFDERKKKLLDDYTCKKK